MTISFFLSLRAGVILERVDDASLVLRDNVRGVTLKDLSADTIAAFASLANVGAHEERLAERIAQRDGPLAVAKFRYYLGGLEKLGWLLRSSRLDGQNLATLIPVSPSFQFSQPDLRSDAEFALSRFVYLRNADGEMIVESPLAHARVILHDPRVAVLLHALSRPRSVVDLIGACPDLPADVVQNSLALLIAAGMITVRGANDKTLEDENTSLLTWEFHDLLFHSRSRQGRHDYPCGGTFRFRNILEQPPALKSLVDAEAVVDLYRPDLNELIENDVPLARVQEERRSIREYGSTPITIRQLGEFLFRVGRVKKETMVEKPSPRGTIALDLAQRPYPAAGGLYELELYVVSNVCEDLAPGLYYYEPQQHQLRKVSGPSTHTESLLLDASRGTTVPRDQLQVLIIIASRFQRLSWKYSAMAYAATLKNVGVLFQTMYLVATAMKLAPCAVGSGNSDLFARAISSDYCEESSVGEFLLGSSHR